MAGRRWLGVDEPADRAASLDPPPGETGQEGSWRLYWADRNNRWREVPDVGSARTPEPLLAFIDRNPAAFWG